MPPARRLLLVRRLLLACSLLLCSAPVLAATTPAEALANRAAQAEMDASPRHGNLPSYQLQPAALARAQHLAQVRLIAHFGGEAWGIVLLIALLALGVVARYRDLATAGFRHRWLQGYSFLFLLLATTELLSLPIDIYRHALSLRYGLSVQAWGSWLADVGKSFLLTWAIGGLAMMLLFLFLHRFPRRWWLVFWAASVPMLLLGVFATPYVIDPLFDRFEPLAKTQPALVERLKAVAERGHMDIPPERMFLMKASDKVTTMNAYVTGFGASKRVVVWDTSLQRGTPDQILLIFGHESGHYVLNHIVHGILMIIAGLFFLLWLSDAFVRWLLRRFGPAWRIPAQADWATIAIVLLAFALFSAAVEPLEMTIIRATEHDADVYGQEAVHGLVADPKQAARGAFELLGAGSYSDPNPAPFVEFWTYSHPAIGRRAAFGANYDPWVAPFQPKYFPAAAPVPTKP